MSEKIVNSVISALIGGVVGATVVFFSSGNKTQFEDLEVGNLTITKQAKLLNSSGEDDLILKDGSVMANNVVLGKKFIGTQYQGHVFVCNRMFVSPDNLSATPMEKWKFYTELGASDQLGGELIVRSPNGANIVGQQTTAGNLFRIGFDPSDNPQLFASSNQNGSLLAVPFAPVPKSAEAATAKPATASGVTPKPSETGPVPSPAPVTPVVAGAGSDTTR